MTPGLVTMSTRPPAATATTARPDAIASSATNPRVSVSLGIMKMSADAYAADSSSPRSIPCTSRVISSFWKSQEAQLQKGKLRVELGLDSRQCLQQAMQQGNPHKLLHLYVMQRLPNVMYEQVPLRAYGASAAKILCRGLPARTAVRLRLAWLTVKYTGRPSKCLARSGREGPSPTKHRQALEGRRSRMPFSASRFFSARAMRLFAPLHWHTGRAVSAAHMHA